MRANALILDLPVRTRVVVTRSDVLGGHSWNRDFIDPSDACVALEEVGLIPPGSAALALGHDFADGFVVSEDREVSADTLLSAGFRAEKMLGFQ